MTASTIVVDSSAILAILLNEPERTCFIAALDESADACCSAVTFVEAFMVAMNRVPGFSLERHAALIDSFGIRRLPVDEDQSTLSARAFLRFGKGRHPAKLNLGDCFSYALAKSLDAPLLYKGEDFSRTDIVSALAAGARP
ncbi:type II toxin-antitoxin system VapC family toxin [Bosea sp. (in: a-proteobacteria)]|uniref:type II toxin-antitoxin system VapC family toxin n=1 Tax=Bosea sp. (in: a-proteobacteria) TaxID=1871050 RepID=UPI0025BDE0D7|nr:type II toxin-antitoxin system VapC family toxin [Bosea sp. (in: a-proteobacteria)]